jgi:hypothetical protein
MTREEKDQFLRKRGWATWYNDNYYVHPKVVADPSRQDYTNYGMNIDDAYRYETTENVEKFPYAGLPGLSRLLWQQKHFSKS